MPDSLQLASLADNPFRGLPGPPGQPGPQGPAGPAGAAGAAGTTPGVVQLAEVLLAAPASSIAFSNIVTTYRHLYLVGRGRMSTSNASNNKIFIQFNSDTGANYDWKCSSDGTNEGYGDTGALFADFLLSTDLANVANPVEIRIPYYRDTTWHKSYMGTGANQFGTTNGSIFFGTTYGRWRSTAAISSIQIVSGGASGQFAINTIFSLYGMT